ncbi:hypothetical protein GGI12_003163 [Dipsacomyces acuminosporus]|nr:hypothetical protein GGI12_003163 [Dipsacomyces acuminosporus]
MDISKLGHDIFRFVAFELTRGFDTFKHKVKYGNVLELSTVCRSWRELLLPYVYSKVYIDFNEPYTVSNAKAILNGSYIAFARKLEIIIRHDIDSVNLVELLERVGFGKTVWTDVTKLEILFPYDSYDGLVGNDLRESIPTLEQMVDYLHNLLPNIKDVSYAQKKYPNVMGKKINKNLFLVPNLIQLYSTQIHRVTMDISGYHKDGYWFPRQLTCLTISMGYIETAKSAKIFAPLLQFLKITCASTDITWNWFDSDDSGNDVWFTNLTRLSIEFSSFPLGKSYHNGDLSNINSSKFCSEYLDSAKRVHFPALQNLEVLYYPFSDDSFYRVFEGCPLRKAVLGTPNRARAHIAPCLLSNISDIDVAIQYHYTQFEDEAQQPAVSKEDAYNEGVARLLSSPSVAQYACVRVQNNDTVTLPSALAWSSVKRLELNAYIDMTSLHTILAHMPLLKSLRFKASSLCINSMRHEGTSADAQARQQPVVINKSLVQMAMYINDCSKLSEGSLQYCLLNVLLLVPSLLKLRVNQNLVGVCSETVFDPDSAFGWISRQLEIAPW